MADPPSIEPAPLAGPATASPSTDADGPGPLSTIRLQARRRVKHFHHPVAGEFSLSFNRLDIAADHGLTLFTYAAEPGTRSEDA